MKNKCYVSRAYKPGDSVFHVYLEHKLQEDSYGVSIFKLNC